MDDKAFSDLMASLDTPMAVVTTAMDDERAGCLVGFHVQSSIDPSRYCVWLSKANHTHRVVLRSSHLAIHFLTDNDHDLAEHFGTQSGDDLDKFASMDFELTEGGVPLLTMLPNRLFVQRIALLDEGGDHVCVVTEPLRAESTGRFAPLRLSAVEDLTPGHEAEERNDPPTERAST